MMYLPSYERHASKKLHLPYRRYEPGSELQSTGWDPTCRCKVRKPIATHQSIGVVTCSCLPPHPMCASIPSPAATLRDSAEFSGESPSASPTSCETWRTGTS